MQAGEPSVGTWLNLGSPLAAEWLANLGRDFVNIDQAHGAVDATLTLSPRGRGSHRRGVSRA